MKNKTAAQWLEKARKDGADWVDKALENIKAQPLHRHRLKHYPSLSWVVAREFYWDETDAVTQGEGYWQGIYNSIVDSENKETTTNARSKP